MADVEQVDYGVEEEDVVAEEVSMEDDSKPPVAAAPAQKLR